MTPAVIDQVEVDGTIFRICKARREDVATLVSLLHDDVLGGQRETADLEPYLKAYDAIARDPAHLLVAVRDPDDVVVATMQLTLLPGLARAGATRMQVEGVRVSQEMRGHGLGGAVMTWVCEHARRQGAGLVQLTTDRERVAVHGFYERLGFTPSHIGLKLDLTEPLE